MAKLKPASRWVPCFKYGDMNIYANDSEVVFGILPNSTKNLDKAIIFTSRKDCKYWIDNEATAYFKPLKVYIYD